MKRILLVILCALPLFGFSETITVAAKTVKEKNEKFHLAKYPNGMIVATCLNGSNKGYQGIIEDGIQTAESINFEWKKGYFVHYYPGGHITSYPKSQTLEIYEQTNNSRNTTPNKSLEDKLKEANRNRFGR